MLEYRVGSGDFPCSKARALKLVAADATGKAETAAVAVNHATVSAGKSQEGHEAGRQPTVQKMRLEAEEIGRPWGGARRLRRQLAGFPGAVSGDYDPRPQLSGLAALPANGLAKVSILRANQLDC